MAALNFPILNDSEIAVLDMEIAEAIYRVHCEFLCEFEEATAKKPYREGLFKKFFHQIALNALPTWSGSNDHENFWYASSQAVQQVMYEKLMDWKNHASA